MDIDRVVAIAIVSVNSLRLRLDIACSIRLLNLHKTKELLITRLAQFCSGVQECEF